MEISKDLSTFDLQTITIIHKQKQKTMTAKDIINAYVRMRTIDNTIPDNVLDFMKNAALAALTESNKTKKPNTTSKDKKEIIEKIESLLVALDKNPIYFEIASEIHMDCQQRVKGDKWTTHLIFQYFPTHATIEVYRNDFSDSDADDTYDMPYSKMGLSLLKEILTVLQKYTAALVKNSYIE